MSIASLSFPTEAAVATAAGTVSLGEAPLGFRGTVTRVSAPAEDTGLSPAELERRLLELGFIEGARVEIMHEGLIRRDPIAVRIDNATVALRRRDAAGITVEADAN